MTKETVRKIFKYDKRGFLIYRKQPLQSKTKAGKPAQTLSSTQPRYFVRVNKKLHAVHRLIYLWHYGVLPPQIDHINGNSKDNRIENLRPANDFQNQANKAKTKRNTSGFKGVEFCRTTGRWRARIMANRKKVCLGRFDTPIDAALAYDKAAMKLHKDFARTNLGGA